MNDFIIHIPEVNCSTHSQDNIVPRWLCAWCIVVSLKFIPSTLTSQALNVTLLSLHPFSFVYCDKIVSLTREQH